MIDPPVSLARSWRGLFFCLLPCLWAGVSFADPPASPLPASAAPFAATPAPDQVEWADDASDVPEKSLAKDWPVGAVESTAEVEKMGGVMAAGVKEIRVGLHLVNHSAAAQRILLTGLRFQVGGRDNTPWFFVLPLTGLPADIPAQGRADQEFRVDTFSDTPPGAYRIMPEVVCLAASADLLYEGEFEKIGMSYPRVAKDAITGGWVVPADAAPSAQATVVKAAMPYAALSQQIAGWKDFDSLFTDDARHIAAQGAGLLEVKNTNGNALEQTVADLTPGQRYIAGADTWNGQSLHVELRDAANKSIGGQDRGYFPACWRGRTISFRASKTTASGQLSLSGQGTTWWDNAFFAPEKALRRAAPHSAALTLAVQPVSDVSYLGQDTDTQGNWTGKYGHYAFILCGMSAPEDMVGGQVKPLKCDYADMSHVYADETIRVSGPDTLRYASWTGAPRDAAPRHWIDMPMRLGFDRQQALDNPQWGYRTSASQDDHGETYAWGPDLYFRLRMPPGEWRVSYYFLDPNFGNTANPRTYRLAFLDTKGQEICTARVLPPWHGQGVYKVFRVRGGRDVVLRIRKDFSINAIIAGVFVDPLTPQIAPPAQAAGITGAGAQRLKIAVRQWRNAAQAVDGFAGEVSALDLYRDALLSTLGRDRAKKTLDALGDRWFADGEYWRAAIIYGILPPASSSPPLEIAQQDEYRAVQFRSVFSRYAARRIGEAVAALKTLPPDRQQAAMRSMAARFFDVAIKDHTDSHGLQRLPMILAKTAYDTLESEVGYDRMTATERAKKLAIAERMTWYTIGWDDVVNEALRFWPTLTEKQKAMLGPGFFADHVIQPLGVLAQSDPSALDKATRLVNDFAKTNPNTDAAAFAQYQLAAIEYQQGKNDQARTLCSAVIIQRPKTNPAFLCKTLLDKIH